MYDYLITTDGSIIYPAYLSKEDRKELRDVIGDRTDYMYCSCSAENKLYYRVSVDHKIIPCHQNYVHKDGCCRGSSKLRYSSFVKSDNGNMSIAFLKFNPAKFTVSFDGEDDEEDENINVSESEMESDAENTLPKMKEKKEILPGEYREPYSSLGTFVKQLNYDTYMCRLISGKKVLASKEYFINAVYGHLSDVKIFPMKKTIKELDIGKDGYRFFYAPVVAYECSEEESSITLRYYDKEYKYFMFPGNMRKAIKQYKKYYGEKPDVSKGCIMAAGFLYQRMSRNRKSYKTPGRIVLFDVSNQGIYCVNDIFRDSFNTIFNCLYQMGLWNKAKVYLSVDEPEIICVIRLDNMNKYLKVYYNKATDEIEDECCIAIACEKEVIDYDILSKYIRELQK